MASFETMFEEDGTPCCPDCGRPVYSAEGDVWDTADTRCKDCGGQMTAEG